MNEDIKVIFDSIYRDKTTNNLTITGWALDTITKESPTFTINTKTKCPLITFSAFYVKMLIKFIKQSLRLKLALLLHLKELNKKSTPFSFSIISTCCNGGFSLE